jgi:hypothetical protein
MVGNNKCIPSPSSRNDVQFTFSIAVPRDSALPSSFVELNKRFQVYSNNTPYTKLCPMIMTLAMDSLSNMNP